VHDVIWKTHPTYTDYEVSNTGRVRSKPRISASGHRLKGRELVICRRTTGYVGTNICVGGKRINFDVHTFVCETYHGLRPEGLEIRHLNGDRTDNRAENLAWGTKQQNQQDIKDHGRNHELNKTHCKQGHPYDEANTRYNPKNNKRSCRTCCRIRDMKRAQKRWSGSKYTPEYLESIGISA
jgi:hypothetical protein